MIAAARCVFPRPTRPRQEKPAIYCRVFTHESLGEVEGA